VLLWRDSPNQRLIKRILEEKREVASLRRIITPQRDVIARLARRDFVDISTEMSFRFRDIYDHVVRLHDLNESLRDLVGGAQDTYLSVINNRMNEIMKTLTIITVLFMPLTFLTGYFGMNFFEPLGQLKEWTTNIVFYITLATIFILPFIMYFWSRKTFHASFYDKAFNSSCFILGPYYRDVC